MISSQSRKWPAKNLWDSTFRQSGENGECSCYGNISASNVLSAYTKFTQYPDKQARFKPPLVEPHSSLPVLLKSIVSDPGYVFDETHYK